MSAMAELDEGAIRAQLSAAVSAWLVRICILEETESTNSLALNDAPEAATLYLAGRQSGGRGRLGRSWYSPPGNLYFSLAWCGDHTGAPLSLLVGAAAALALEDCGAPSVALKWPNDLRVGPAKLGGILIETDGSGLWVAGIGVNLHPIADAGQPATSLTTLGVEPPCRNILAAGLVTTLHPLLSGRAGSADALLAAWRVRDCCLDRPVRLSRGGEDLHGIARGIDEAGRLLLETDSGAVTTVSSGEISLHLDPQT
ncbi:MAG: biotin--[acetyl-CoA-carboxylase] ligase [Gammaproteobacteria bacterium AqS3]|nr:biotin--[acetyl-CoA-carboxylase] ligase [Gammaproteobacteria bacterium AqS3]